MQDIKILYAPVDPKAVDDLIADGYEVFYVTDKATYLRKDIA